MRTPEASVTPSRAPTGFAPDHCLTSAPGTTAPRGSTTRTRTSRFGGSQTRVAATRSSHMVTSYDSIIPLQSPPNTGVKLRGSDRDGPRQLQPLVRWRVAMTSFAWHSGLATAQEGERTSVAGQEQHGRVVRRRFARLGQPQIRFAVRARPAIGGAAPATQLPVPGAVPLQRKRRSRIQQHRSAPSYRHAQRPVRPDIRGRIPLWDSAEVHRTRHCTGRVNPHHQRDLTG